MGIPEKPTKKKGYTMKLGFNFWSLPLTISKR